MENTTILLFRPPYVLLTEHTRHAIYSLTSHPDYHHDEGEGGRKMLRSKALLLMKSNVIQNVEPRTIHSSRIVLYDIHDRLYQHQHKRDRTLWCTLRYQSPH